jgi:hypothetical protein
MINKGLHVVFGDASDAPSRGLPAAPRCNGPQQCHLLRMVLVVFGKQRRREQVLVLLLQPLKHIVDGPPMLQSEAVFLDGLPLSVEARICNALLKVLFQQCKETSIGRLELCEGSR